MIVDCMGLIYSMAIYLGEIGTECNTRWNGVHQFKRENWITEIVDHFLTRQDLNIVLLVPNECLEKGTRDVHSNKSQFTIISLLHCANSKPKFRNQFMTQLTVRNKNCILRDNRMHIQSLHFNTFIISCEIRSDFPISVSTDRNGPTFILICCRS